MVPKRLTKNLPVTEAALEVQHHRIERKTLGIIMKVLFVCKANARGAQVALVRADPASKGMRWDTVELRF